jgi:hypothetical protein
MDESEYAEAHRCIAKQLRREVVVGCTVPHAGSCFQPCNTFLVITHLVVSTVHYRRAVVAHASTIAEVYLI